MFCIIHMQGGPEEVARVNKGNSSDIIEIVRHN